MYVENIWARIYWTYIWDSGFYKRVNEVLFSLASSNNDVEVEKVKILSRSKINRKVVLWIFFFCVFKRTNKGVAVIIFKQINYRYYPFIEQVYIFARFRGGTIYIWSNNFVTHSSKINLSKMFLLLIMLSFIFMILSYFKVLGTPPLFLFFF